MSYFFRERDLIKTIQKPSALPVGFLGKNVPTSPGLLEGSSSGDLKWMLQMS
jgi:hypothetical protein